MRPTPPSEAGSSLVRIDAQLFAFDVVAGQLAQAELVGVVADALKAQFAAQLLEVEVVALGQRLGHVHAEAGQLHRGVAGDQALRERGHGDGELDGGAGLGARRKSQLLVDHGQNAAVGGVDDHGGAVHVAQGVDGGLADDRVFAGGDVAREDVAAGKGTGGEALVVMMAASECESNLRGAAGPRLASCGERGRACADSCGRVHVAAAQLQHGRRARWCSCAAAAAMRLGQMRLRDSGAMERVRGVQRRRAANRARSKHKAIQSCKRKTTSSG